MAYQLKTFADLYKAVMEEVKVGGTDTVSINRIKRDLNIVYSEVVSEKRWWWLQENTTVQLQPYVSAGSVSVTQNSSLATLTVAPTASKASYWFSVDGYSEIYRIESHAAGSLTLNLSDVFTGATNPQATYKIWTDRIPLPVDCKETVSVWHDHTRSVLENVGIQEYRKLSAGSAKAEGKPAYCSTSDFTDPSQATAIVGLPSLLTRSSVGMIKTLVFSATLPSSIVQGSRLRISQAGETSYNGDVYVSAISTTTQSSDTLVFMGRAEVTEAATADTGLSVLLLGGPASSDRYRQLYLYPCLSNARLTLHVDYVKEALALDNDWDEPLLPVEERVVLLYGALHRAWSRERNPEEAQRNYALYQGRIKRMAGKLQDTLDNPRLAPSRSYLDSKRSTSRGNLIGGTTAGYGGGGSGSTVATGTPNSAAIFNSQGVLQASPVSSTALSFTGNLTSDAQAQINAKQDAGPYVTALTGDVSAVGPGSAAATVNAVGGSSATAINTAELAANAATNVNTASTIVKRDASGNFSAGTITASLSGNASTATSFTGSLAGDVTGTQSATAIAATTVTGKALTGFVSGAGTVSAADSVLSALNKHDGNIALKAPIASPTFTGTVTGTFSGNITGNVTGNASGTAANVTGTVTETHGGTNQTTYATGDTLYSSAANTLSKLAGNITTTKKYLGQTGSGAASAAPVWTQPAFSELSGSVAAAQMPALTGDVTSTAGAVATTVAAVGGSTAANVNTATVAVNTNATSAATASVLMKRDASANTQVNNLIENLASTATAAGTTSLTVSSAGLQQFTGSSTQTVNLPDATTLTVGTAFTVFNRSTGTVTVKDGAAGHATVQAMLGGSQATFTCTSIGTAGGAWDTCYTLTGTLPISLGGTGATTKAAGFDALQPMTTLGDIVYGGTAGTGTRLAGDTSNTKKFLTTTSAAGVAAAPGWNTIAAGDVPTLNQNTTGTAANVTGTVLVANGGTGATTLAANNVLLGNGTSALQTVAPGTSGNVLQSNGTTWVSSAPGAATYTPPTVQKFLTAGSGTYTKSAGVLYIRLRGIGPGGGGAGSGTTSSAGANGAAGGNSTFGSTASTTISTTNASTAATVASGTGIAVGQAIISANVPLGTTVSAVSGTSVTLSANATATASGTAVTFAQVYAGGGAGAAWGGSQPSGGTAVFGTGISGIALSGGDGSPTPGYMTAAESVLIAGGNGASTPFGSGGVGGTPGNNTGFAAKANTGAGGGGGAVNSTANSYPGPGGAAGGFVDVIIPSPSASYALVVGAAGAGGNNSAGAAAGGAGGSGFWEVTEYYQ